MPHVSDMGFLAPIFAQGQLIGFSGSIAHKADIGGTNPGSTSANATEMFQEGLLVPPVKIARKGRYDEDMERLILANSRQPDLVRGDVRAQIAATEMGARRMAELGARFGAGTVMAAFAAILDGTARAIAAAIRALPEGDGIRRRLHGRRRRRIGEAGEIRRHHQRIGRPHRSSISQRAARQAKGPVNLRPSMVEACVFYSLIGALAPELKFNDGMRDVVSLRFAPRTVTNAAPPAPVSSYQKANLKLVDVILEALGRFVPERAIAGSGSSGSLLINWSEGRARPREPPIRDLRLGLWRRQRA